MREESPLTDRLNGDAARDAHILPARGEGEALFDPRADSRPDPEFRAEVLPATLEDDAFPPEVLPGIIIDDAFVAEVLPGAGDGAVKAPHLREADDPAIDDASAEAFAGLPMWLRREEIEFPITAEDRFGAIDPSAGRGHLPHPDDLFA